uniref:Uncharacterized protein n=1 Tax=Anguilla anguilla TaxID=7936 RepID=A0A0E9UEX5_ANGAN
MFTKHANVTADICLTSYFSYSFLFNLTGNSFDETKTFFR